MNPTIENTRIAHDGKRYPLDHPIHGEKQGTAVDPAADEPAELPVGVMVNPVPSPAELASVATGMVTADGQEAPGAPELSDDDIAALGPMSYEAPYLEPAAEPEPEVDEAAVEDSEPASAAASDEGEDEGADGAEDGSDEDGSDESPVDDTPAPAEPAEEPFDLANATGDEMRAYADKHGIEIHRSGLVDEIRAEIKAELKKRARAAAKG